MTPPTPGSGGHTTLFRLVTALERAGHTCVVYLYDRWGGRLEDHRAVMRAWWPQVRAEVHDAAAGIEDAHAVVATRWPTAYAVLASPAQGHRFYLVQDLEPLFYPKPAARRCSPRPRTGSGSTASPRAAGSPARWPIATGWRPTTSTSAATSTATGSPRCRPPARTGVCFFARPITPRRAFDLGALALEVFAARRPDVDIHLFGDPVGRLAFPATDHGVLTPSELNDLYQRCAAGLVLSATNVSLVPHEMLAAGCIPVVNDAEHNRVVLDNPHVAYATATPHDIADALCRLVDRPADLAAAGAAAAHASVRGRSWDDAGTAVEQTIRRLVDGAPHGA